MRIRNIYVGLNRRIGRAVESRISLRGRHKVRGDHTGYAPRTCLRAVNRHDIRPDFIASPSDQALQVLVGCQRVPLTGPVLPRVKHHQFQLLDRYNVAPSTDIPVIRLIDRERVLSLMRWGLIPFWAKDTKIGYRMINARSETVATKPAFRAAYKARRCLIPAAGFYEWRRDVEPRQPHYIHKPDGSPMGFAGLWENLDAGRSNRRVLHHHHHHGQ